MKWLSFVFIVRRPQSLNLKLEPLTRPTSVYNSASLSRSSTISWSLARFCCHPESSTEQQGLNLAQRPLCFQLIRAPTIRLHLHHDVFLVLDCCIFTSLCFRLRLLRSLLKLVLVPPHTDTPTCLLYSTRLFMRSTRKWKTSSSDASHQFGAVQRLSTTALRFP